jgi:hypothetical protein
VPCLCVVAIDRSRQGPMHATIIENVTRTACHTHCRHSALHTLVNPEMHDCV